MRDAARMALPWFLGRAASSSSFIKTSVGRIGPLLCRMICAFFFSASYCLIRLTGEVRHAGEVIKMNLPKLPYAVARGSIQ